MTAERGRRRRVGRGLTCSSLKLKTWRNLSSSVLASVINALVGGVATLINHVSSAWKSYNNLQIQRNKLAWPSTKQWRFEKLSSGYFPNRSTYPSRSATLRLLVSLGVRRVSESSGRSIPQRKVIIRSHWGATSMTTNTIVNIEASLIKVSIKTKIESQGFLLLFFINLNQNFINEF